MTTLWIEAVTKTVVSYGISQVTSSGKRWAISAIARRTAAAVATALAPGAR